MSKESKLWMGNIENWMNEQTIMKVFKEYNFNPKSIQFIKNVNKGRSNRFCFINFFTINEANDALTFLNGKYIPNANLIFNLKWANPNSENIDIFVGNLSPEIDNITLFNLFNEKYPSVHHAFIITNNNKISKGYGFINFLKKEESEKCIKEMNGYIFYNKALKVEEKRNNYHKKIDSINPIKSEEAFKNEEKEKNAEEEKEEEKEEEEEEEENEEKNEEKNEEIIGNKVKKNCSNWTYENLNIEFIGILKGHEGPVTSLIYSEDKNGVPFLFSGSEDSSIIQWELFFKDNKFQIAENFNNKEEILLGKPKNILNEHEDAITSITFDSEHNLLISSSLDKKIIIRDINDLNKEPKIIKSSNEILSLYVDNKIIFSGEKNKKLKFFNLEGKLIKIEKNLGGCVTCILKIATIKKKIYYIFGLSNGNVVMYNEELNLISEILYPKLKGKYILKQNYEDYKSVASLTADKYGEYLFVGYRNGIIKVYRTFKIKAKLIHDVIKNGNEIKKILFEDEFFEVVFIGDDNGFKMRPIKGNKSIAFNDFTSCLSLCFSNNKNYLFAGFGDGIIRIYRINHKDN